jgi:rubrerythrin
MTIYPVSSTQSRKYRPGGSWFCPACGVEAEVGPDFVRCPTCTRALNEFLYEIVEYHPHP